MKIFFIILIFVFFVNADIQKRKLQEPLYFDYYRLKSVYIHIPILKNDLKKFFFPEIKSYYNGYTNSQHILH